MIVNSKSRWRTGGRKLVEQITKKTNPSNWGIIGACKELIFDIVDGAPAFHAIMYSLDTGKVSIKPGHLCDILINKDQSAKGLEEDICNILAVAAATDVPVYPNSSELIPTLAKCQRTMLVEGFTAPDASGKHPVDVDQIT